VGGNGLKPKKQPSNDAGLLTNGPTRQRLDSTETVPGNVRCWIRSRSVGSHRRRQGEDLAGAAAVGGRRRDGAPARGGADARRRCRRRGIYW
jgi:hypothetical protein